MFPRVLLDTNEIYLAIDWFGIGRIVAVDVERGFASAASPAMKTYFLETFEALQRKGIRIHPSSPVAKLALTAFSMMILNPDSLMTRAALSQSPEQMADGFIEQTFRK